MLKMPPPVDPSVVYVEGYYWVQNLRLGSLGVLLYKDGHWHRWQSEEEIGVVEGPLPPPTEAQMASWEADYEVVVQRQRAEYSHVVDPCWFDWVDGYYWVHFEDDEPEIAFVMEDSWQSLVFAGNHPVWGIDTETEESRDAPVLVGPLVAPKVERKLHS